MPIIKSRFIVIKQMIFRAAAAAIISLWGNIIYILASCVFLITVTDKTKDLSAIFYLSGSFLFALSDAVRIPYSEGLNRVIDCLFCFSDSLLTIGSIFFFPSLERVVVGNWIFEIAGWLNFIWHMIKFKQLYDSPPVNWKMEATARGFTVIGVVMFILGNILLINNAVLYFNNGFILFTTGSCCFVIGNSLVFLLDIDTRPLESTKQVLNLSEGDFNTSA